MEVAPASRKPPDRSLQKSRTQFDTRQKRMRGDSTCITPPPLGLPCSSYTPLHSEIA